MAAEATTPGSPEGLVSSDASLVNGTLKPGDDVKATEASDNTVVPPKDKNVVIEEDSPQALTSTAKSNTSGSFSIKLTRPSKRQEYNLDRYIGQAHAQVKDGAAVASSDQEKETALVKYAELTSQLSHILAVMGLGRNTTVRALAYLNGAEQPTAAQAVRQARQDRREQGQGQKRRAASHGSKASLKTYTAASKATTKSISVKTPSDESESIMTPALTTSDQASSINGALADQTNHQYAKTEANRDQPAPTAAADGSPTVKNDIQNAEKKANRPRKRWWKGGKGRRHTSGTKKDAESQDKKGQDDNTNQEKLATDSEKVDTGVTPGTPDEAHHIT